MLWTNVTPMPPPHPAEIPTVSRATMKSTNFEFIRTQWPLLADDAADAENTVHENPRTAGRNLRTFCEALLKIHFKVREGSLGKLLSNHGKSLPRELKDPRLPAPRRK
jgi:hypothetical protein